MAPPLRRRFKTPSGTRLLDFVLEEVRNFELSESEFWSSSRACPILPMSFQ
jgi:hypothetical protein